MSGLFQEAVALKLRCHITCMEFILREMKCKEKDDNSFNCLAIKSLHDNVQRGVVDVHCR